MRTTRLLGAPCPTMEPVDDEAHVREVEDVLDAWRAAEGPIDTRVRGRIGLCDRPRIRR